MTPAPPPPPGAAPTPQASASRTTGTEASGGTKAGADGADEAQTVDAGWRGALAAWLAAHRVYPEAARRAGEQGRVAVRFTIDRSGRVLTVALAGSSGTERLDEAAQAMLRGQSVPPLPPDMPQDRLTVTVTIRYALTR
ncbi:MAG: energy transducer TonB [Rhodospirillales bacterium]|nr:energy transducer TonB [Rhodospirillales bacterium]